MRQVGSRKEGQLVIKANGRLLEQGARFNESVSWLSGAAFVPKGVYRYRSHEEANQHAQDCLVKGMGALAALRR
ncbi:MAG: hypothetical protein U5N10_18960 [Gemmobacter sp.]|nr:hypothetical protein [Gemmobacter sp.]